MLESLGALKLCSAGTGKYHYGGSEPEYLNTYDQYHTLNIIRHRGRS